LLGAEMNAVIEHMSAEGKDKGAKDPDEQAPAVDQTATEPSGEKDLRPEPATPSTVVPRPQP